MDDVMICPSGFAEANACITHELDSEPPEVKKISDESAPMASAMSCLAVWSVVCAKVPGVCRLDGLP